MPALDDPAPILGSAPFYHPAHPSPSRDGLRLEVMSPKEIAYHGHIFGVDIPYLMWPTGWGEFIPDIWGSA